MIRREITPNEIGNYRCGEGRVKKKVRDCKKVFRLRSYDFFDFRYLTFGIVLEWVCA
jgi:hypothetical protein